MTGMGTAMAAFFQTTTMIISIPSVVILTALIMSLWGGSIRFNTPMLFAVAFLPMFGIGGLHGLPLGLNIVDIPLHDIYTSSPTSTTSSLQGTIFAFMAGIYYWYPKATGRKMNETLGKIHFWGSFVCMNVVFMPMFIIGMAGVSRRSFEAGTAYAFAQPTMHWNVVSSWGAWALAVFQIPFIFNFFWSIWKGDGRGEPVAGHDDRVGALASAARQFRPRPASARGPTSTAFPARARTSCPNTRPDSRWTSLTP